MRDTALDTGKVERFVTAGVDIGARAVKVALLLHGAPPDHARALTAEIVTVGGRRDLRDAQAAVREGWDRALRSVGLVAADVALVASTGTPEHALAHVGHFYRGVSLAAGVRFLFPLAVATLDVGARQMRCTRLGSPIKGRGYVTTPKWEIWGSDTLDTIARTHGVATVDVVGLPAAIAAYDSLAARAAKLVRVLAVDGPTAITGALARDPSFLRILARRLTDDRLDAALLTSPDAVFTGAYGAALLAARRFSRAVGARLQRKYEPTQLPSPPTKEQLLN